MRKPPASTIWHGESNVIGDPETPHMDRWRDPDTGVKVLRLTSLPCVNSHIYPEAPVSTPDGKRFLFSRFDPATQQTRYWIADLDTRRVRQATDETEASPPLLTPDGRWWLYMVGPLVIRMDPETYEREEYYTVPPVIGVGRGGAWSISHCGNRMLVFSRPDSGVPGIAVVDLAERCARVIFRHPDRPGHMQYCRAPSCRVLTQVNDGIAFDAMGNCTRLVGEDGCSLWVGNDDGTGFERLNLGSSPVLHIQGHECWVGKEERVILTLHTRSSTSAPWVQGRIVTIARGESEARVVGEGEGFTHIHTSPDGQWWVSDCNRTARVFVGSVRTGRYKLFVNTGATFGHAQYTHPHPFFLGDGRTIGWNSDVSGVPHVYVARLPDGFTKGLV
jgi:hypothetical protein